MDNYIDYRDIKMSKRLSDNLNLFWLGFMIYFLSYTLTTTLVYIKITQLQLLQIVGILIFTYASINIIKFRVKNKYLQVLFYAYCLWSLTIIARGFTFDFDSIKEQLFEAGTGIFIYFVPLILLFPHNFSFYKKVFNVILIFALFYVLYCSIFSKDLLNPDRKSTLSQGMVEAFSGLSFTCGFVLFTYIYHDKKKRIFALGIMVLTLLFAVYRARRGTILMCVSSLLFYLMMYLIVSKKTFMVIYLAIFIAALGALFYSNLYNQTNFGIFNFLVERADEDTRTGVEVRFKEDMTTTDWIIGKGLKGEYFCPGIDEHLDTTGYRPVIETGYLQIILKGGLISLILLLLILVPALIRGLFYSKNVLSKACGMWILLWILYLYPTMGNTFSLNYMLVWIGVGICYSKKFRNLSDAQIKEYFTETKKSNSRARKPGYIQPTENELS
ncbi:hypothetical protein [Ferruginibacter sp.]|nr:hypothetical protein [Ferruginibacter sp.]